MDPIDQYHRLDLMLKLVACIQTVFTITVAVLAFLVSYWNHKNAKKQTEIQEAFRSLKEKEQELANEKFKLDLFDKRFKVYEYADNFEKKVVEGGGDFNALADEFVANTACARFLFGEELQNKLNEYAQVAMGIYTSKQRGDRRAGEGRGGQADSFWAQQDALELRFKAISRELYALFEPYMKFKT